MSEDLDRTQLFNTFDFYPLRIRIFRNGDVFDEGRLMAVTRREFKHWVVFLDAVTVRLRTPTAVRRIFTIHGCPISHFDELENRGEYVAVETGAFLPIDYGKAKWTGKEKKYNPVIRIPEKVPPFLHSAETMDIYLKKEGYGTITGLPYPFDGILARSPSSTALQMKHYESHTHIPPLKIGGSMEHLNTIGTATSVLGKDNSSKSEEKLVRNDNDDEVKEETKRSEKSTKLPKIVQKSNSSSMLVKEKSARKEEKSGFLPPIGAVAKVMDVKVVKSQPEVETGSKEEESKEEMTKLSEQNVRVCESTVTKNEANQEVRSEKMYVTHEAVYAPKEDNKKKIEERKKKATTSTVENPTGKKAPATSRSILKTGDAESTSRGRRIMLDEKTQMRLYVADTVGEEIEDVLNRAKLWEKNKRRITRPRYDRSWDPYTLRYRDFDPDFD